jgi:hypothetical protein
MEQGIPGNTLPSAEQIRLAIYRWWPGGGRCNLIVNVLRREGATASEAVLVAGKLAERTAQGKSFLSDEVVSEHLEMVRAVAAASSDKEEQDAKSPTPSIGSAEWHRRAAEKAVKNAWAENPYKSWKWEKPAKQRRGL